MPTPLASTCWLMTNKVQIIHKTLGVGMWVTESELAKFLEAGHKLASAPSEKPTEEEQETPVEQEPKKRKRK